MAQAFSLGFPTSPLFGALAMAKKQPSGGAIPADFQSPFSRVAMDHPRGDDALACVATLTGRSLDEITKFAVQIGYPPDGPAYVANAGLLGRLLHNFRLVADEWQEVTSFDALPDVAILMVDWHPTLEYGRHVVWHHVRGTDAFPSFSYVIDPRPNIPVEQQVTTNWSHLKCEPAWYIEVTKHAASPAKRK
jgi:hypothetical protein